MGRKESNKQNKTSPSLKHFYINVSFHIIVASLTMMALFNRAMLV